MTISQSASLRSVRMLVLLIGLAASTADAGPQHPLRVSDDKRYLVQADGSAFFYLGDTAWELFHRLNREEALTYLRDRAAKGFTVIQAVALAEEDGLNTPNSYGHRPLANNDPTRPDVKDGPENDYWDHVDFIVEQANELGLTIGLLPTWGDKWHRRGGFGPEVFTVENAGVYGEWIGKRYADRGVIWILGGDRPIENETHHELIQAMANGIERGDRGRNLMTFHPSGRRNSADVFHDAAWLDFNMIQSGHQRPAKPVYAYMLENLSRSPSRPTLDGEPCYEDHPHKGETWNRREQPGVLLDWFDEWDVRVAAYQSMLAGACGHTYGDHNIWQMWLPGRPAKSVARTPWPEALHHPGSLQMKYFRNLFEARPFWKLRSRQQLVAGDNAEGPDHLRAALADDASYALISFPTGRPARIAVDQVRGTSVRAWWFNPRQNSSQLIGELKPQPAREFRPPTMGRNNDWVLVLEDAAQEWPRLGYSYQNLTPKVAP